ncbi:MAG: HD domain-containing protein [Oscillospiraceae bacterium]
MTSAQHIAYEKALEYATDKHCGQIRKGGLPYITHPVAVAEIICEKGFGLDYQIAALFHDLLEDTDATEQEIEALSNREVLSAVKLLTKAPGYQMEEYVRNIRANAMAFAVKGADRLHNLRCAIHTDTDFKRKYILETVDWYLDFSAEIPLAVKELAQTLDQPIVELSFLYEPIETWKINQ